jgi:hypothetical protein
MPSSLSTLEALVRKGLGGRDDDAANIVIDASINYSTLLAAILFEPPELMMANSITILANANSANISSYLTNHLDVKSVYNSTGSCKMWCVPWEGWEIVVPANVGAVKYFTIFGDTIYVKDTPVANTVLAISCSAYPSDVVNGTDTISFDHHDSFIVSTALGIARAFFEKGVNIEQAMNMITLPLSLGARARQIIEGVSVSADKRISQTTGGK